MKNEEIILKIKLLSSKAKMPTKSNPDDVGMDLYSIEDITLWARNKSTSVAAGRPDGSRATIHTGIAVEFPPGYGLFIWDRSGISAKHGQHRVAGVVDPSYRGEICVALVNLSNADYVIKEGDRIAQMVLMPIIYPKLVQVDELSDTNRGTSGWGGSGR